MSNIYEVLDSGHGRKLEQAGPYRIVRPALNAFWAPALPESEWKKADAVYIRNSGGSGRWEGRLPAEWQVEYAGFQLKLKPTGFGHLGFFAEQYRNWNWFRELLPRLGSGVKTLNLFAYSGVGSMAMAAGGAEVCHLDAAKGMIDWGRENMQLNPGCPDRIRWIVDDAMKFCKREVRRGSRYQLIALDPPSFGRGAQAQVWKIEDDLPLLLDECRQLLELDRECYVVLSCHSPGFSPETLGRILTTHFGAGSVEPFEMGIPEKTGKKLPAGFCAIWSNKK